MDIIRRMIKDGAKVKLTNASGEYDPYEEWYKWLAYIPETQKIRIDAIEEKSAKELTIEELEDLLSYKKELDISKLFEKVISNNYESEEHLTVYDYIKSHKLQELMLKKLTKEELIYARDKIKEYTSPEYSNELSIKIKEESKRDNFKKLSMVDSYILNCITKVGFTRSMLALEESISAKLDENEAMRRRSWIEASKSFIV